MTGKKFGVPELVSEL